MYKFAEMSKEDYIKSFSEYLFWDVDRESIDFDSHAPYVVKRVLEYGKWSDWKLLVSIYGIPRITAIAKNLRSLDTKSLSFIAAISSSPIESFRCFTMRQSVQTQVTAGEEQALDDLLGRVERAEVVEVEGGDGGEDEFIAG